MGCYTCAAEPGRGRARTAALLYKKGVVLVPGGAAVCRERGAGAGLHWDEQSGKQRLGEVMGRMKGPREQLEAFMAVQEGSF